jgi:ubiquinone/menaquinone biosynthesis C-methylase UbiE
MPPAPYDRIGGGYDSTRRADSFIVSRLLAHLNPQESGRYLDVACGTGNYTLAFASAGVRVVGVDSSPRMVAAAARKASPTPGREPSSNGGEGNRDVPEWAVADVTRLPFPSAAFAGASCTLALRYFADLDAAIAELGRVVGAGPIVLFTATPEQIRRYWLRAYFPETVERTASQAYSIGRITDALRAAGFSRVRTEPYAVKPDLEDLFLYSGKHRPSLYLSPAIRAGMWSFANLAPPTEEATGCAELRRDVASGRIADVLATGDDPAGDYLFVVAER